MSSGDAGRRRLIAVLGRPGLVKDAVRARLAVGGAVVVRLGDWSNDAGIRVRATVLVDPTSEHWLAARAARAPIVVVISHDLSDEQVANAVLWGAEAVLHPCQISTRLVGVLDAVLGGQTVLTGTEVRSLATAARAASWRARPALSAREREIGELIAKGLTVKQTALALGISAKTVENLQGRLFRKLRVRNRAQVAAELSGLWAAAPGHNCCCPPQPIGGDSSFAAEPG